MKKEKLINELKTLLSTKNSGLLTVTDVEIIRNTIAFLEKLESPDLDQTSFLKILTNLIKFFITVDKFKDFL